jgi:hypothetical protein
MTGAGSEDKARAQPLAPVGAVHMQPEPPIDAGETDGVESVWTPRAVAVALLVSIAMVAVLVIWLQSAYQVVPK